MHELTPLASRILAKVVEHDIPVARALQITGNPVTRQALHARIRRHRAKAAATAKKEVDNRLLS